MIKLGNTETAIYILIWSSGVIVSLYNLHLVGAEFNHSNHEKEEFEDFAPGWFNRYRDISDFEWNCWTQLTIKLLPWLLVNFSGAYLIRRWYNNIEITTLWYCIASLGATTCILNSTAAGIFLLIASLFYISSKFRYPHIAWVIGFLCRRYVPVEKLGKSEEDYYLIEVASSWLILRCIAYVMESARSHRHSFPIALGYSLYLPTMFCGPLLSFSSFLRCIVIPYKKWNRLRVCQITWSFLRCGFWYLFTIIGLHFIYVNAVLLRPYMVARLSAWQLAGLGIAMGHFFHLKYLIFYGVPCSWASAEGFATPRAPCCVSRVYLYSAMWRYFDHGLYLFLVRYIYVPVIIFLHGAWKILSRTAASVFCFVFVYVWHGEGEYVMYWSLLNFFAVTVEAMAREFYNINTVRRKFEKTLSPANIRRLHCVLAAPLHYFSMLSNFFFIGSLEVGKIYFIRALIEPVRNTFFIIFILYGAAQAAVTIEMLEKARSKQTL